MFGKNQPKREPKEVKFSDFKVTPTKKEEPNNEAEKREKSDVWKKPGKANPH
jgi:hypothetical protein